MAKVGLGNQVLLDEMPPAIELAAGLAGPYQLVCSNAIFGSYSEGGNRLRLLET